MYRISYVGGVVISEVETAKANLKIIIESYLNNLSLQRSMNQLMREMNLAAAAAGTQSEAAHRKAISEIQVTAKAAADEAKIALYHIQQVAKKDPKVWNIVDQAGQAIQNGQSADTTATTPDGTKIQIQTSRQNVGVGSQVGIAPIIIALVIISVAIVAVAVVCIFYLNRGEVKVYCETARVRLEGKRASAKMQMEAGQAIYDASVRLANKEITKEQYDIIVAGAKAKIDTAVESEKSLPEKEDPPADLMEQLAKIAPWIGGIAILGGVIYIASQTGLFGVAKKQIDKRWG